MSPFSLIWQRLTRPPDHVADPERRRQLQLLAGLQLLLVALGAVAITLESRVLPTFMPTYTAVSIGMLLLLGGYALTRMGRYNVAAVIAVSVTTLTCFAIIFLNPRQEATYAFLSVSLVLASLLFYRRGLLLTALILLLGVCLGLPALGLPPPNDNPITVPIFLVVVCAMLLSYRQHLRAVARDQQAALANQSARLRALVDNAFDAIISFDANGAINAFNPAAAHLFGYSAQEILGKNISLLIPVALSAKPIPCVPSELLARHKDGREFPVELTISEMHIEGQRYSTAFIRDISLRRAAEERVMQLNRLLRTITAVSQMVVRERSSDRLLAETCRILIEYGEYRMAWIGLADIASGAVRVAAKAGVDDGYLAQANIRCDDSPQGRGPTGLAIREGRFVVNNDGPNNPGFAPWRESARQHGYGASAAFPLRVRDQVIGAVTVYALKTGAFQQEEVELLNELVEDLGYALQMIEMMAAHEQAERALEQSEANFRALTVNANVGILVNCHGRHVFGNAQILKLLGYSLDEFRQTGIAQLVHPDEYAGVVARFEGRMAGTPSENVYETIFLTRDRARVAGGNHGHGNRLGGRALRPGVRARH